MDDSRITPNASQQYLMVNDGNQPAGSVAEDKRETDEYTLKSVTLKEWVIVIVLCFVNMINYMDRYTVAGVLTDIKDEYILSDSEAGLLQTVFIVSYMIFAPLFGYLGDRYNRKIIMCFGIFLWCLFTFVGSFAKSYGLFIFFRALVGIGEASYSTIAPTIISDLFVKDVRSALLAMFYFAIPVGSGLGYIVGGEMGKAMSDWRWALRVTPILGVAAIVFIAFLVRDPARGEKEGSHLSSTSYTGDLKALLKNRSFMLSTAGFTCVSFVTGALAFWGPTFIYYGLALQYGEETKLEEVSYKFGVIAMSAGLIGVPTGSFIATKLRSRFGNGDPLICAFGLLISSPLLFFGAVFARYNSLVCYILIFLAQITINMNWSIVADMLLYVVLPTRRSTAEAFQILFAHLFGDAGSPYLIGVISDSLKTVLLPAITLGFFASNSAENEADPVVKFRSLQYALFVTIAVEILGSLFFFFTALYIETDKEIVDRAIAETQDTDGSSSDFYDDQESSVNNVFRPY